MNTLPIVVATLATGAAQAKYGVYEWNAANLFLLWNNRAAQFFCAACFILSNIGINITSNAVYAMGYEFLNSWILTYRQGFLP